MAELTANRWMQVGQADLFKVWVRREDDAESRQSFNIFQLTTGPNEPPYQWGGFRTLNTLLEIKGLAEQFVPNAVNPPSGWVCASQLTKEQISGAIFEKVMGDADQGLALFDMTIARDGDSFVPIHGGVKMLSCRGATEAARKLQDYWEHLPNSSRMATKRVEKQTA